MIMEKGGFVLKKVISALGIALAVSGILSGCRADHAAYYNPNAPRDVNYRVDNRYNPNAANPNVANPNATNPNAANPNTSNPNVTNPNPTGFTNMDQTNPYNRPGYKSDQSLAKKIADRANAVGGIARAHVVVTRDNVAIGAIPERGRTDMANLRKKIQSAVQPLVGNRTVYVSTDNRYVQRITAAETNFNAGKGAREVRSDIVGIIDDLSRAVKRPFQNNSK